MATRTVSQSINLQADQTSKYITRISSDGITVHPEVQNSGSNYIHIDSNGLRIKNQEGSTPAISTDIAIASFTANGAIIGKTDGTESYLALNKRSMQMVDKEGDTYFYISDLRNDEDIFELTDTFVGDGSTYTFYLSYEAYFPTGEHTIYKAYVDGVETTPIFRTALAFEIQPTPQNGSIISITYNTTWRYAKAYTLGFRDQTTTIGPMSYAEGYNVSAQGRMSHAEGYGAKSIGQISHAEGQDSNATGFASHAEGMYSKAIGTCSHAEGAHTNANGQGSHAEGNFSKANGEYSHAQNKNTIAGYDYQTVMGRFNDNKSISAFEIGNGEDAENRSNAITVDWEGNVDVDSRGSYSVGGTNILELVYPVGSIYMSVNSTDPGTLFGGTWTRLTDTFLLAAGSTYAADNGTHTTATGGAATVQLNADNLPSHHHSYTAPPSATDSHTLAVAEIPAHYHQMRYNPGSTSGAGYSWGGSKYTWSSATESSSGMKGAGGGKGHTHSITGSSSSTGNTGSGTAHNNMPPYLPVYMWKRTA